MSGAWKAGFERERRGQDTPLGRAKLWAPTGGQVVIAIVLEVVTTVTTVVPTCLELERALDGGNLDCGQLWTAIQVVRFAATTLCCVMNGAPSSVRRHGKPARTFLKVLSHLVHQPGGDSYSLVEVSIDTGRRHQIRSHLAFIGHPLVGDAKYSSSATFQSDHTLCNRNFLHRVRLSFLDVEGKPVEVADALPPDLQLALSALEAKDNDSAMWKPQWC
ncbi:unnamed protein product [Cladocopium goreaui]|uniref:Uncharacterized RNA pseudouridine synthase Caur_0901 (RNA pseudouridylate synthase) (RNA-uridin e isomerase) n=1 Tax=Cladocopium goreaui TaxID=2562237 RepID=A0A9P1CIB1_9DINO|nr:unnamed protein product [Cladocopium goreaui]